MNGPANTHIVKKLVHGGEGMAIDGHNHIFIPFVLPGEEVRLKILPGQGDVLKAMATEIVAPSPDRVEPPCPLFGSCGGCQFQHIAYPAQVQIKNEIFRETMVRLARAGEPILNRPVPSPREYGYRSRVRLHVKKKKAGFFARGSSELVVPRRCPVAAHGVNLALGKLGEIIKKARPKRIELRAIEEGTLAVAANDRSAYTYLFEGDTDGGSWREVGPGWTAFQQVNPWQNKNLRELAGRLAEKISPDFALELHAGDGNLTAAIAPHAGRVLAADMDPLAVKMARLNPPGDNVRFEQALDIALLERVSISRESPDLVFLDPPRTGARRAMKGILKLMPEHVVYVSCEPSTLARDMVFLLSAGYSLVESTVIDMFPQTAHIESVNHLSR